MNTMNLADIRGARRNLGITQAGLARMAGVSQAFVARLESGKVDPSFSKVQRVFSAMEKVRKTNLPKGLEIRELMTKNMITVESRSSLRKAAQMMKKKNISQLPVTEKGRIIGSITEANISHAVVSENPETAVVGDFMNAPMPVIDINSNADLVIGLLDHSPAILITKKGSVSGIITRADVLKLVRK